MSFTNHLEIGLLDHVFGGGDYVRPAVLHVGLSTTAINEDGTGITEPAAADGYARVAVDNNTITWEDAATATEGVHAGKGLKTNKITIEFPEATADWATVTHMFLTDGTNVLAYTALETPRTVEAGQAAKFGASSLVITLD